MATKKYWKEQYDSIIKTHHKYNTKGYSFREFLEFNDEDKKGLLSYYTTKSLLASIEDDEMFRVDLHIIPCPDAELCNFLQS
jgi:hypothetical protein